MIVEAWGQDSQTKGLRIVYFERQPIPRHAYLRWLGQFGATPDVLLQYHQVELEDAGWEFLELLEFTPAETGEAAK